MVQIFTGVSSQNGPCGNKTVKNGKNGEKRRLFSNKIIPATWLCKGNPGYATNLTTLTCNSVLPRDFPKRQVANKEVLRRDVLKRVGWIRKVYFLRHFHHLWLWKKTWICEFFQEFLVISRLISVSLTFWTCIASISKRGKCQYYETWKPSSFTWSLFWWTFFKQQIYVFFCGRGYYCLSPVSFHLRKNLFAPISWVFFLLWNNF